MLHALQGKQYCVSRGGRRTFAGNKPTSYPLNTHHLLLHRHPGTFINKGWC